MKKIVLLSFMLVLLLASCIQTDKTSNATTHPSYGEIEKFFVSNALNKKFEVQDIKIDRFSISTIKNYQSDSLSKWELKASYDLNIVGKQKDFVSKAELTSNDSIHWKMNELIITEKHYDGNVKTENTYKWDLGSDSIIKKDEVKVLEKI